MSTAPPLSVPERSDVCSSMPLTRFHLWVTRPLHSKCPVLHSTVEMLSHTFLETFVLRRIWTVRWSFFLAGVDRLLKVLFWMVLPSSRRSFTRPHVYNEHILLSRQFWWTSAFDLRYGFCSARAVSTVAALSAILSKAELVAKDQKSLASSATKKVFQLLRKALKRGSSSNAQLRHTLRLLML